MLDENTVAAYEVARGRYASNARRFGREWALTSETFAGLASSRCHYCGAAGTNQIGGHSIFRGVTYQGVDRVDNRAGYVPGNVVPCCFICNRAKAADSVVDFVSWLDRVSLFRDPEGASASLTPAEVAGYAVARIINDARLAGRDWELSKADAVRLVTSPCHYCGDPGSNVFTVHRGSRRGRRYKYNGIDRVDNQRGYQLGNCVPCCVRCNRAKQRMSELDFRSWAARTASYREGLRLSVKEQLTNIPAAAVPLFVTSAA